MTHVHPTRLRMLRLQIIATALLLAIAAYILVKVPLDTRILIESFSRTGRSRAFEVGTWAVLLAPAIIAFMGYYARNGRDWDPETPKSRRITWTALIVVDLCAIGFQLLLARDALAAVAP